MLVSLFRTTKSNSWPACAVEKCFGRNNHSRRGVKSQPPPLGNVTKAQAAMPCGPGQDGDKRMVLVLYLLPEITTRLFTGWHKTQGPTSCFQNALSLATELWLQCAAQWEQSREHALSLTLNCLRSLLPCLEQSQSPYSEQSKSLLENRFWCQEI